MPRSRSQSRSLLAAFTAELLRRALRATDLRAGETDPPRASADRRRWGDIGCPPWRQRFELLERAPDHVDGPGQGHAELAFALASEAGARRQQHAGRLEHARDEIHRSLAFGNASPDEERAARGWNGTMETSKPVEYGVAALAIDASERGAVGGQRGQSPSRG